MRAHALAAGFALALAAAPAAATARDDAPGLALRLDTPRSDTGSAGPGPGAHRGGASPGELSGWLILGQGWGYGDGYHFGVGAGVRYRLPLVPEGILNSNQAGLRDSIDLEFGGDLVHYAYGYRVAPYRYDYVWWALRPRAGLMWDFWLTPRFAVYPKLDLGYEFGWFDGWNGAAGPHPGYAGLFLEPSLGLIWKVRGGASLRAELGSEGLKLGVGVAF